MKRIGTFLLLLALLAPAAVSCAQETAQEKEQPQTTLPEETVGEGETELVYPRETEAYDGLTFNILNCSSSLGWPGSNHIMDYEETTGNPVEDAVYNRNRRVEEKLGITLHVIEEDYTQLLSKLGITVQSDEAAYDVAYVPLAFLGSTSLSGIYAYNLYEVDGVHFEDPWWNPTFAESAVLKGNRLYALIDYANLMSYAYGNVMYFNQDMMKNHNLELPYDLVRSGEWTYDRMYEYMQAVVNLNGDSSFKVRRDGSCIYGYGVMHEEGTMTLVDGCGEFLISRDADGMPILNESLERLSEVYDRVGEILSGDGYCVMQNTADLSSATIFSQGRALFLQTALGASGSQSYRAIDFTYGILPMPKYEAAQSRYYTMVSQYTLSMVVPLTCADPGRTGNIMDYLEFYTYKNVIPTLQDELCYKGMRNNDSIDMFNIILDTSTLDIGYMFSWTSELVNKLSGQVCKGKVRFASSFASEKEKILSKIDRLMEDERFS